MRIAVSLVVLLLAAPTYAAASPIVFMEFLNSDFTFGPTNAEQYGWDLSSFTVDGFDDPDWDVWNTGYQAVTGALDSQTFQVDAAGAVVGSDYVYLGGTFEVIYVLENGAGETRTGSFLAPIDRLTVRTSAGRDDVELFYELGRGLFDLAIADTLGVSRRTRGGEAYAQLLLTDGVAPAGAAPELHAEDGVNDILLDVPEPATLALLGAGGAAWWVRRRRHTR